MVECEKPRGPCEELRENREMREQRYHRFLSFILAGMEVCWLYTALVLMREKSGSASLSPAVLLVFYGASWVFHRFAGGQTWSWVRRAGATLGGWLVCTLVLGKVLFSTPPRSFDFSWVLEAGSGLASLDSFPNQDHLFLVSSVLLWWAGRRLTRLAPGFSGLVSEFQFGLTALLILFFMDSEWGTNLPGLVPVCLAFFAFSFVGISLAHGREGTGWLHGAHRVQWLSILVIAISTAFALGLFLSVAVKPELLKLLLSVLKVIWQVVSEWISRIIAFLVSLLPKPEPVAVPPFQVPQPIPAEPPSWVKIFRIPAWFRTVGQIVVSGLWVGLILAALWSLSSQIIHWLRQKLDHGEGVSYEPMSGAFKEDILRLLQFILSRIARVFTFLRGKKKEGGPVSPEVKSVRQIYLQLLDWAASAGCPRHAAQTPREYLRTLIEWLPEARWEFSFITHQYVYVRYGSSPPTKDGLDRLAEAWGRLRRVRKK
jgi:hypothetical protein